MSVESQIKDSALGLGFDLVGITTAEPFERDEQAASQRVRDGLMDGLPWYNLERVHRMNRPLVLLEGARSVISLAVSYNTSSDASVGKSRNEQTSARLTGKIARYARGDDYHKVIKKRLRTFVDGLPDILGHAASARVFVDDGPMNDRAAAERAGVGWFGKNTNILTPSHGSWVFLAQVITDVGLRPDAPLKKTCGNCVRCIDDCPTGAIVAPYVLDNRRCISYLTIELRGVIPRELRPLMGDWAFGCDICQDVCPVNRKTATGFDPAFQKRHDFDAPELLPLLELGDEEFRERFRNSPIKRAKRVGLQRNVCVALGNLGDARAVPALSKALVHDDLVVRLHAAWALGRIGGEVALGHLKFASEHETDTEVMAEVELSITESESSVR
ncbi:MAG: tRNA epoxyqueuosine(34) reductase QueG [SAR202 cluster bacterium]|mgnify:CR=1 FL=1|jgi:epoxyqueuosine reductase|nr:tRNA epoxyqueuosine(34) reductase QueG [SAR202 cluster bacterium]MDP6512509.1 tRNA epoxyqueuosine(34) reductase QueG [SAR202 cluster bacterium]